MTTEILLRYPYRVPVWAGLLGLFTALFLGGFGKSILAFPLWLSWLLTVVGMFFALAALASSIRRSEVVLTEHAVTATLPFRRSVSIDFAAVNRLETRAKNREAAESHGILEIHAPGRTIVLFDSWFPSREAFDHVVAAVSERVAAHGGPEIFARPRRWYDIGIVA